MGDVVEKLVQVFHTEVNAEDTPCDAQQRDAGFMVMLQQHHNGADHQRQRDGGVVGVHAGIFPVVDGMTHHQKAEDQHRTAHEIAGEAGDMRGKDQQQQTGYGEGDGFDQMVDLQQPAGDQQLVFTS